MVRTVSALLGLVVGVLAALWAYYGPALLPGSSVILALEYVAVAVVAVGALYLAEVYG